MLPWLAASSCPVAPATTGAMYAGAGALSIVLVLTFLLVACTTAESYEVKLREMNS